MKPEIDGEEVTLREGSRVLVREVQPGDRPLFVAGFERMSEESRYKRFMSHKNILREDELDFLTQLDHRDHEAIGAIDPATECGVGVARMVRSPDDREEAEAAVAVVDDWQGRGLGSVLLDRLAARARELGVQRFSASLFTGNRQMLTLFEHLGCVRRHNLGHDTLEIAVDLPVHEDDESLSEALRSAAAGAVHALPPSRGH